MFGEHIINLPQLHPPALVHRNPAINDSVEMIPTNYKRSSSPRSPLLEVSLPGELLHRAEGEGGLAGPEHRGGLGRLGVHCSLQIFSVYTEVRRLFMYS